MANITSESAKDILDRAISDLAQSTQITRFSPGSKARALLEIMSSEIERLEDILNANMILSLLNGASGIYLDFLGDLVGVSREQSNSASVLSSSRMIRVYSSSGLTAGAINNGREIVIPGNTILRSTDDRFRFLTTATHTINPNETETYVSARSVAQGELSNIPVNTLSIIEFTNYAGYPDFQLAVENISAIDSGASEEEDSFFRFRISNALLSAEKANATAIRFAALSVPSISDVIVLELFRGIGTSDLILDTASGEVSNIVLQQVRDKIRRASAVGMDIRARAPKLIGLEVTISVRYASGTSLAERQEAQTSIRNAISELVQNIPIGGEIVINDLALAARTAHPKIIDIGRPNQPIDEIVLWRPSQISGRAPLVLPKNRNIELDIDQRLTLEGSLSEAVRILQ